MRLNANYKFRVVRTLCLAGAVLTLVGCTSSRKSNDDRSKHTVPKTVPHDNFDGGTYCVQNLLQAPAPAKPLHISYKVLESDPSLKTKDYEADLVADTLDVTYHERWLATDEDKVMIQDTQKSTDPNSVRSIKDGYAEGTFINHYARSDEQGWRMAVTSLAQGGTPWNLFVSRPTVNRVGPETVNGYDTIKYSVDTTNDSQTDKAPLRMFSKLKDYNISGTAWVLKDANCVLQYNIDYQQEGNDGKISKTHYEGAVTKQ